MTDISYDVMIIPFRYFNEGVNVVLATIGLWLGLGFFTGTLRGRHRAMSGAFLLSTGLYIGSGMIASVWAPQAIDTRTMPAWGEVSREDLLGIAILGLFGCVVILCYSFLGEKKE